MKKNNSPRLVKTKYGFYQYQPSPSAKVLAEYYSGKYFQQGRGSYAVSYLPEEVRYFKLKPQLMLKQVKLLRSKSKIKNVLDIGCGEGWILDAFFRAGFSVRGIDYSVYGIEKFHPQLKKYFEQGDVFTLLNKFIKEKRTWDMIILANVIEHVVDPVALIDSIKRLLSKSGLLLIVAPNDFSHLHKYLLQELIIDKPFWLGYPDHLSYFNKESMGKLLRDKGFKIEAIVADNPIDSGLLNANSNYIRDKRKGKNAHLARVRNDNFLASISKDKLLELYSIYGQMGVGRDLNYFCGIRE